MAKITLIRTLIKNANTIKDKISKLIKGDPAAKYKADPEYRALMKQVDDIDKNIRKEMDSVAQRHGIRDDDNPYLSWIHDSPDRDSVDMTKEQMDSFVQAFKEGAQKHKQDVTKQQRLAGAKYQPKPLKKGPYETIAQKKEKKPRAKGGMVKRPQMMQGGAYKGKKHSYAAGGKVTKLNF